MKVGLQVLIFLKETNGFNELGLVFKGDTVIK